MTLTDENDVQPYHLPDLLQFEDGRRVGSVADWRERRGEIIRLFEAQVYGAVPQSSLECKVTLISSDRFALNGLATRKQARLTFQNHGQICEVDVLLYLPNQRRGAVPLFMGLNFDGNHTVHTDPGILISQSRIPGNLQQDAHPRGMRASRWAVELLLQNGFGLATACYNDIAPDMDDGFQNGIHPLFYEKGQTRPLQHEWGTISAWSWGLSRMMDYCQQDPDIDPQRVAVLGHSRLGKAALWAGALDERFALVISNNSGCGGAALSRRKFGETVADINSRFPHWFCGNFKRYNGCEENLPIDQHMLLACIAPRPLYVASASEDLWADPRGEFLSAVHAAPAYEIFGKAGLTVSTPVQIETPLMNTIGYHLRNGAHDITHYDWAQFIQFANNHRVGVEN